MINKQTNNHTNTKTKPMIKSFTETNSAEYLPFPFCLHQFLFCFVLFSEYMHTVVGVWEVYTHDLTGIVSTHTGKKDFAITVGSVLISYYVP